MNVYNLNQMSQSNIPIDEMISKMAKLITDISNAKFFNLYYWVWNINCLNDSKFNYLTSLLHGRVHNKILPHIILLTETWIKTSGKFQVFNILNYKQYSITRGNKKKGGGVSVYIQNKITSTLIKTCYNESIEYVLVKLELNTSYDFYILALYRPPSSNINEFLKNLEEILQLYDKRLIIAGDMNIRENNNKYKDYADLFHSYGYERSNNATTFSYFQFGSSDSTSGSILDNVLISDTIKNVTLTSPKTPYSDHNLLMGTAMFDIKISSNNGVQKLEKLINNNNNTVKQLKEFLREYNPKENKPLNENCDEIMSTMMEIYDTNCQTICLKTRDANFQLPKWVDKEYVSLCNHIHNVQEKVWKLASQQKSCDILIFNLTNLTEQKKEMEIRKSYIYYNGLIYDNPRQSWKVINDMCGKTKTQNKLTIVSNGTTLHDDEDVANALQNFFITSFNKNHNPIQIIHRGPYVKNTFQFNNVSEQLIFDLIISLDMKKSPGYDNITPRILKSIADEACPLLCYMINRMINDSEFPDALKVAKVIPIHKKGSKTDPENYRQISVLPIVSKVFEKVIFMQLDDFFESNNLYDDLQFGFRSGRGCHDAICQVMFNVSKEVDKGNGIVLLSLDISKAFDSLKHNILLRKLEFMGIRGASNDLIKSYLSHRCQFVQINSAKSCSKQINEGIAQGSLVGPPFFNFMLIDMKNLKTDAKIIKYADDAVVVFLVDKDDDDGKNSFRLQQLLNELVEYYRDNGFEINCNKSFYMCLGRPEMVDIKIMLNSAGFQYVNEMTYLGIIIDDELKLGSYVDALATKMNQGIGALFYMKDKLPFSALKQFYFAHIHSHLMYCSFILLRCTEGDLKRLQRLQNRALKLIYQLPILCPTTDLFTLHAPDVLTVKGIIYYSTLLIIKRNLISTSPERLPIEKQRTNRLNLLKPQMYRRNVMKNDVTCRGINIYNNLPSELKELNQLNAFKRAVKTYLLKHVEDLLNNTNFMC